MTTSLLHRRRAERFAQLLDEAGGGRRHHVRSRLDEELTDLVTLRHRLVMASPRVEMDPEFDTGLRAMLVATAEREGIGATAVEEPEHPAPAPRRASARAPRARTAVIAGVTVGAVAFTGISTASENAMPGDALYGVKRSTERAQLALASSDLGRGELYLGFARNRLDEALAMSGGLDRVLDDMDADTQQGVTLLTEAATDRRDLAALDAIDRFVASQRETLEQLSGSVTGADRARVTESLGMLAEIEERSAALRHNLVECDDPAATRADTFGPVPPLCELLDAPGALAPLADPPATSPEEQGDSTGEQAGEEQPQDAAPDGTGPTPDDRADRSDGDDAPATPSDEDPSSDEEKPAGDGGLLGDLGRLLGGLLGG